VSFYSNVSPKRRVREKPGEASWLKPFASWVISLSVAKKGSRSYEECEITQSWRLRSGAGLAIPVLRLRRETTVSILPPLAFWTLPC
jgi:hypothetical protein